MNEKVLSLYDRENADKTNSGIDPSRKGLSPEKRKKFT